MTKKPNIWDGIIDHSKPSKATRTLVGLGSWLVVSIYGLFLLIGLIWIAGTLADASIEVQTFRIWIIYGMMAVFVLCLTHWHIGRRKNILFFKYARLPLKIGIGINMLILTVSLVGLGIYSFDSSKKQVCSPLKGQVATIQAATVPIATDTGSGTAFAIRDEHTLLTAYHVVDGAKKIYANYTTGEIKIKVIDTAPELDLALLRISEPVPEYLSLTKTANIGEQVFSNGFPGNTFDAGQATLTGGIISRYLTNSDIKMNFDDAPSGLEMLQTDAALNPGNSGGALVSECGVVGIISIGSSSDAYLAQYGIRSEEGISFAVSSATAAKRFNLPIK